MSLSDLEKGVAQSPKKRPKDNRKRTVFLFIGLVMLATITFIGGYFLLRGEKVDLNANKRLPEKPSSGKDIQKAAFDSISASLSTPSPSPFSQSPAADSISGSNQSVQSLNERSGRERVAEPIDPGIAGTLAPSPDSIAAKPTPSPREAGANRDPALSAGSLKPAIALVTTKSVRFAADPQPSAANREMKPATAPQMTRESVEAGKPILMHRTNVPAFGSMLPVRLMGALYTLRSGSLARFELMRDLKTEHWQMKRGTVLIGNVTGGGADRAFVQIKGFIDPTSERLMKIEGEVLGDDGGAGMRGRTRRVSSVWGRVLDRAAQTGVQLATGILNRGASSVIIATDPYGTIRSGGDRSSESSSNRSFIEVQAGAVGFVMVTTLPEVEKEDSHLAQTAQSKIEFTDQELAELMTSADPARIRTALSRMTPELRQIAEGVIKEIDSTGK